MSLWSYTPTLYLDAGKESVIIFLLPFKKKETPDRRLTRYMNETLSCKANAKGYNLQGLRQQYGI